MPHYLVATFSDRNQANAAYHCLQTSELALSHIDLVGPNLKSLQDLKVFDPNQVAWRQAIRMLFWLVPFGFFAGFSFNDITGLTIWPQVSPLANHCIGGVLGAVSAAMGGFTFGGGAQIYFDKEKAPLAKRLKSGKYLVVAQGTELLLRQAVRKLQSLPSEHLQFYEGQS
jgi:hypothetical protein